jgi:hypothetical protein
MRLLAMSRKTENAHSSSVESRRGAVYNLIMNFLSIHRVRRGYARILLIILLATVLVAGAFIVTHAQHDCPGLGCHTCAELSLCKTILGVIGFAIFLIAALILSRSGAVRRLSVRAARAAADVKRIPLFTDSVRLNF